ncbi:MAG: DegT/DnrJ/EryC1/StrS family aminotransferase [Thermodesulfobacteriota bacterium]
MNISLSNPDITEKEIDHVTQVLRTRWLSLGPKVGEFERKVAEFVGVKHAIAVNSGTSGLHLCVKALGIGKGDYVITSPFSFIASANCLLYEGAIPLFVDVLPDTYNLDPWKVEEKILHVSWNGKAPKAIVVVDIFGCPANWDHFEEVADRFGLRLIGDSCEAFGAEYYSRKRGSWVTAGSMGDAAAFGFYPNKSMTTGEGGCIVTDNDEIASLCRSYRNQGRDEGGDNGRGWLHHVRLGYNYRLSDVNCALGIAQMERIEEIMAKRCRVAGWYNERLGGVDGIHVPYAGEDVRPSWFVYVIRLDDSFESRDRDRIIREMGRRSIQCKHYFPPIHLQPFYAGEFGYQRGDFPIAEAISDRTIALPFYNNLTEEQVDCVVETLKELL